MPVKYGEDEYDGLKKDLQINRDVLDEELSQYRRGCSRLCKQMLLRKRYK